MIQPILPDLRVQGTAPPLRDDAPGDGVFAAVFAMAGPVVPAAGNGTGAATASAALPVFGRDDAMPSEPAVAIAPQVPIVPPVALPPLNPTDAEGASPVAETQRDVPTPVVTPPPAPVAADPAVVPGPQGADPPIFVAPGGVDERAVAGFPFAAGVPSVQPHAPQGQPDPDASPFPAVPAGASPRMAAPAREGGFRAQDVPIPPMVKEGALVEPAPGARAVVEVEGTRADGRPLPGQVASFPPDPQGADRPVAGSPPAPATFDDAPRMPAAPLAAPTLGPADLSAGVPVLRAEGRSVPDLPPGAATPPSGATEVPAPRPALAETVLPPAMQAAAPPRTADAAAAQPGDARPVMAADSPRPPPAPSDPPPSTIKATPEAVTTADADAAAPRGGDRAAAGPAPVAEALPMVPRTDGAPGEVMPRPMRLAESVLRAVATLVPVAVSARAPGQAMPSAPTMVEQDPPPTPPDTVLALPAAPPPAAPQALQAAPPAPAPIPMAPGTPNVVPPAGTDLALGTSELGGLNLRLSPEGDGLHLLFLVERPETLDLMRRHADALLAELRAAGLSGTTLDFAGWDGAPGSDRGASSAPPDVPPAETPTLPAPVPQLRPALPVTGAATLNLRL